MARSKTEQTRRDTGLCLRCGAIRGDNSTELCCAPCAEKARQWQQTWRRLHPNQPMPPQTQANRRRLKSKYYAECVAAGLCTLCNHYPLITAGYPRRIPTAVPRRRDKWYEET